MAKQAIAPSSIYSWTVTGWLVVTFVACATHIFVALTGPPDELVMANTVGFQLIVVTIFYVVPSVVLLSIVLIAEMVILGRMRPNHTPHPDAHRALSQAEYPSVRADGRER